jgi:hypothetical protein
MARREIIIPQVLNIYIYIWDCRCKSSHPAGKILFFVEVLATQVGLLCENPPRSSFTIFVLSLYIRYTSIKSIQKPIETLGKRSSDFKRTWSDNGKNSIHIL